MAKKQKNKDPNFKGAIYSLERNKSQKSDLLILTMIGLTT